LTGRKKTARGDKALPTFFRSLIFFREKKRSVLLRAKEHKRALFLHECIDFV
jgi:hypothetical protein